MALRLQNWKTSNASSLQLRRSCHETYCNFFSHVKRLFYSLSIVHLFSLRTMSLARPDRKQVRQVRRLAWQARRQARRLARPDRKQVRRLARLDRKQVRRLARLDRKQVRRLARLDRKQVRRLARLDRKQVRRLAKLDRKQVRRALCNSVVQRRSGVGLSQGSCPFLIL